jgi:uroporphyrinogen-III synthase
VGALAGRRILVTRPSDEAGSLSERLRAEGAEPIEAPAIEILPVLDRVPLDEGIRGLVGGVFEWVAFTSVRAVDAVLDRMLLAAPDARIRARVAAVGPATARRLQASGVPVDVVAEPHTTEALAAVFPRGEGRVLLPRADIAPDGLEDELAAKGWTPVRVDAYHTRFPKELPEGARRALDEDRVDAVAFTSSSTVEGFVRMAGVREGPRVVCIGPVTAEAARRAGFTVDAVASPHTIDGLVKALERVFEEG